MRQTLGALREVPFTVAEENVDAVEVDGEREVHVPVVVEVGGDDGTVVEGMRKLRVGPVLPVTLSVPEEDRRIGAAGPLGRGDDVEEAVIVHVRNGERVAPRTRSGKTIR